MFVEKCRIYCGISCLKKVSETNYVFINFRDFLKLLCKGNCYALSLARSWLRLALKISTPTGRILKPNLASMCITPFDST